MMFFAHVGHDHDIQPTPAPTTSPEPSATTETEPTTISTTAPDTATTSALSPDLLIGGATLLALITFWLLATFVFKLKLATRLSIIMAALLVVGIAGYQSAPITSIVALTIGITTALGIVLAQLGTKSAPKA